MKSKYLFLVLVVLVASLIAISCVSSSENNDTDDSNPPNFINDPCSGCPPQENIGSVTAIRFFSYVKNTGGNGKISMTIGAGNNSATQQFNVTAGTRYIFQASVPVEALDKASFT